jgi:hypothetical protein
MTGLVPMVTRKIKDSDTLILAIVFKTFEYVRFDVQLRI